MTPTEHPCPIHEQGEHCPYWEHMQSGGGRGVGGLAQWAAVVVAAIAAVIALVAASGERDSAFVPQSTYARDIQRVDDRLERMESKIDALMRREGR